ncbi:hypothetical protein COO60DRAFT_1464478 [Scenedesmus sp. NREL 46B-D3]|nr:hypothetical protein COO60DRAFT_1464478 [Scenedesmus sp. NREL 46B-D3]
MSCSAKNRSYHNCAWSPAHTGATGSQAQIQQLQSNLEELKSDFQYNLQLLAERDADLEAADAAAATTAAELAAKVSSITQLQAQLAQAHSGCAAASSSGSLPLSQRQSLQRRLQQMRWHSRCVHCRRRLPGCARRTQRCTRRWRRSTQQQPATSGASFWLGSARAFGGVDLPAAGSGRDAAAAGGAGTGAGLSSASGRYSGATAAAAAAAAGRPLSASADAALAASGSGSPGLPGSSSAAATLATHVLGVRHQQRSHLSSLRSSLESANLVLLGSSATQSPRRRRQQQQEPGAGPLDSSRDLDCELPAASGHGGDAAAAATSSSPSRPSAPDPATPPAGTATAGPAAAAAAAELAVLRADLAASDADTDHLLSHLALLQRHVSAAAAGGGAAGGGAAAAARGPAAARATAEAEAAETLASEVDFLRERVSTLLRDNRHYRRQAMQAQLAALHAAAAGTGSTPPQQAGPAAAAGPPMQLDMQPVQPTLALPPATSNAAAAGVAAPPDSSSQDVLQLRDALAAAEQHLAVLSEENERLMELSNRLRAETEQLKRSLQAVLTAHALWCWLQ